MSIKPIILLLSVLLVSQWTQAAGNTTWAVPTRIDIVRDQGAMIYGEFGNPGECSIANRFFLKIDHAQYKEALSLVYMAIAANRSIRVYIHRCELVGWYADEETTFNTATRSTGIYFR